jgi:hypothetical protein
MVAGESSGRVHFLQVVEPDETKLSFQSAATEVTIRMAD